jgi:membrane-associated phospholipid phosphatase
MNLLSAETWTSLTHFGAAGAILPLVALVALGLWLEGWRRVVAIWGLALALGVAVVLASKVAFTGWGIGSAALNFTGISGHTMLASAVFPVLLGWLLQQCNRRRQGLWIGLLLGLLIGAIVGYSRIMVGAHSWSEVALGWCFGAAIAAVAWRTMRFDSAAAAPVLLIRLAIVPALVGLLAMHQTMAAKLPAHEWEVRLALALSGRDHPYVRQDLYLR